MIGWSPRQMRNTRSSPSTATPATSRCSNPFGSCSQPSTISYPIVRLLARFYRGCLARFRPIVYRGGAQEAPMRQMGTAAFVIVLTVLAFVASAGAQPAGTLLVGLVAEPVALDPAQVTDLNSNRVGRRVVETLVAFAEESTQIVPGLAESWTISKDGLTYTFKLRKGIAFHDGTPFNAQAVKFSIERQINPEHPANKLGKYPFAGYFFGNVKAVEVMDDSTVRFALKEARASFLAVLTAGAASI